MRYRAGDAFDTKFKRAIAEHDDAGFSARAASFDEPTKRELREQIAEAVRNTAALPIKGRKR
jgi:hypothetical protein